MKKVPVILLSGFLGSGKSTLLLRMLREVSRYELRPGVLMNEIGMQDVDGYLLQASMPDLHLAKLLDGCIYCSERSDMSASRLAGSSLSGSDRLRSGRNHRPTKLAAADRQP